MIAVPCPSCGTPSWYSYGLDRYIHCDTRIPRAPCWLRAVQGDIDQGIEMANERAMMRHERRRTSAA